MGYLPERVMADFRPPLSKAATGGQHNLATVTVSRRIEIPNAWKGEAALFQADRADIWLAFGDATVTASITAVSTVASEVPTPVAGASLHIPAGTSFRFRLPEDTNTANELTHFADISLSTLGFFRFGPTTGEGI